MMTRLTTMMKKTIVLMGVVLVVVKAKILLLLLPPQMLTTGRLPFVMTFDCGVTDLARVAVFQSLLHCSPEKSSAKWVMQMMLDHW